MRVKSALKTRVSAKSLTILLLCGVPNAAEAADSGSGKAVLAPSAASSAADPQSAPSPDSPDASTRTGGTDIIVTALKRSESAQRLPAAISVISSDTLAKRGIVDLKGVENLVPSAKMNTENSVVQIFIRGAGSPLDYTWIPTSVGANIDGGPQCRFCVSGAFYDIQRVEVLPGPQGTLYGSSAIGGVVNILTNRPTQTLSTDLTLEYGNYNTTHATLVQNVPITSDWAIRGAVDYYDNDGFNNNGTYDQHSIAARLSTQFTSGTLTGFLTGSYYHNRARPSPTPYVPYPNGDAYTYPANDPFTGLSNSIGFLRQENFIGSGQFDLSLGNVTISYIPAGLHVTHADLNSILGLQATTNYTINQFSNELRVNGGSGRLKWLAGLFQLWNHSKEDNILGPNFAGYIVDTTNKSYAAYGQLTYSVTDKLRLTAGARESRDTLDSPGSFAVYPIFPSFAQGLIPFKYSNAWNRFGWKLGGEFDAARTSMLYFNVQTGFNPGTFQQSPGIQGQTVQPQTMLGYTAGVKNRFFDGRLRLNAEAFYYDYKNLLINNLDLGRGVLVTYNIDKAHIKGVEATLAATPVDGLDLTANVGYLDARIAQFVLDSGNGAGPVSYAGYQLPFAPTWTVTLGAQYTHELVSGWSLRGGVNTYLSSSYWGVFDHSGNLLQDAYSKTDLNLTLTSPNGRWDITGYAKNLENVATQGPGATTGKPYPYAGVTYVSAPRQYGVKLHIKI
jgi:iron complex outermembrane receptor protein